METEPLSWTFTMLSIANNKEGPGVLKTAVAEVKRQAHTRERRSVSDEALQQPDSELNCQPASASATTGEVIKRFPNRRRGSKPSLFFGQQSNGKAHSRAL